MIKNKQIEDFYGTYTHDRELAEELKLSDSETRDHFKSIVSHNYERNRTALELAREFCTLDFKVNGSVDRIVVNQETLRAYETVYDKQISGYIRLEDLLFNVRSAAEAVEEANKLKSAVYKYLEIEDDLELTGMTVLIGRWSVDSDDLNYQALLDRLAYTLAVAVGDIEESVSDKYRRNPSDELERKLSILNIIYLKIEVFNNLVGYYIKGDPSVVNFNYTDYKNFAQEQREQALTLERRIKNYAQAQREQAVREAEEMRMLEIKDDAAHHAAWSVIEKLESRQGIQWLVKNSSRAAIYDLTIEYLADVISDFGEGIVYYMDDVISDDIDEMEYSEMADPLGVMIEDMEHQLEQALERGLLIEYLTDILEQIHG